MSKRRKNDGSDHLDNRASVLQKHPLVRSAPARATLRVARAQRILAATVPDLIYQKPEKPVRRSDPVSVAPLRRAEPVKARPVRDEGPSPDLTRKPRDLGLCKSRPSNSRGSGGSRPFVPWCSK